MPIPGKALFIKTFLSVLFFLCILEIIARATGMDNRTNSNYLAILKNFKQAQALLRDNTDFSRQNLTYYDYHLYAVAPRTTETITFTDYYSARLVPDSSPIAESTEIIWLFGGSTMQNMETTDELTIANSIAKSLKMNGIAANVRNFGVGGFQSSLESIKFQDLLRRVPENERPSQVVFYDGFNDANHAYHFGAGNIQIDLSRKLEDLVCRKHFLLLTYSVSELFSRYSVLWKRFASPYLTTFLFMRPSRKSDSRDNLEGAVSIYMNNTKMIQAICKNFGIRNTFVLQPLICTKQNRTPLETKVLGTIQDINIRFIQEYYALVKQRMADNTDFLDLSGCLDSSLEDDFYDLGHTGPCTGAKIGRFIAERLISEINTPGKTN